MVQDPEEPALVLKRNTIPTVYSPPPEKPINNKDTGFRRLLNRQQSITRGTASSIAKAVRASSNDNSKSPPPPNDNTLRRKFSLRNRKPSLVPTSDPQRRSSWSPFNNASIIVPDSPPLVRKKSKLLLVETPPPEEQNSVDAGNQQITSSLETPPSESSPPIAADEAEHVHHHEDDLPGYMRRPICAACTRNVKVTSSSETNHLKSSNNSSRRSSFSTTSTKSHHSLTTEKLKVTETVVIHNEPEEIVSTTTSSTNDDRPACSEINIFDTTRSYSPTSPIPSRKTHEAKDKWCQLLSQQQRLLSTFAPVMENDTFDPDLISIQQNISKLVTAPHQEQYETLLLETQTKVLQKFAAMMQRPAIVESPVTTTTTTTTIIKEVPAPPMITPTNAYVQYHWQTKLEFSLTRWKWNLSQWTGAKVGTGTIEELDFDSLGYPENVIISGICVTTEPELLPKSLQKYYKPYEEINQVICHKYTIHLTREKRLLQFQIKPRQDWIPDEQASACEFGSINSNKACHVKFGLFNRRHHCRSCGHIFCHAHSSNELPLFVSNGEDRGEWARVCDLCFYSRIEPQCISRT